MNSNKRYSIIKYITSGCWIITGILGYCNNSITDVIRVVLPLILLLIVPLCLIGIKSTELKKEAASIAKAKSVAATAIYYILCAAAVLVPMVYLLFDGKDWNWMLIMTYTFFIMIGIIDVITGIAFGKQID